MTNTRVEVVLEFDEFIENIKTSFINLFPEDFYIRILIVLMALVVGYGVNKILTDTPNIK